MTAYHCSDEFPASQSTISDSSADEQSLLIVLFYADGRKREFDYDESGGLRGIDHGDGTFWLRSDEGQWFILSDERNPERWVANINLDQDSGKLQYETDKMRVTELPSGELICESVGSEI